MSNNVATVVNQAKRLSQLPLRRSVTVALFPAPTLILCNREWIELEESDGHRPPLQKGQYYPPGFGEAAGLFCGWVFVFSVFGAADGGTVPGGGLAGAPGGGAACVPASSARSLSHV